VRDLLEPVAEAADLSPPLLVVAAGRLADAYVGPNREEKLESLLAALRKRGVFSPEWMNMYAWDAAVTEDPGRGRLLVAETLIEMVMAKKPTPDVQDTYAWVLYRLGDYNRAATQEAMVVGAGNVAPDFYYRYAAILAAAGKKDAAEEAYRKGTELRQTRGSVEFRKLAEDRLAGE